MTSLEAARQARAGGVGGGFLPTTALHDFRKMYRALVCFSLLEKGGR